MDCRKVGALILRLRKEKHLTQKEVADAMHISDKTISKWERGLGCPDVSLLRDLSHTLGVNIEQILNGDLDPNEADGGNMKNIKFYACSYCGNVMSSTGDAGISCCGRKLAPLIAQRENEDHHMIVEEVEDDYYVTIQHEMSREHFISFIAFVAYDRMIFVKLYPEQNAETRIPKMYRGTLYAHCSQHGLWSREIRKTR
ncbi:helix-turn-helix domain-containing protein [Paenibacillus lemnae]|uniref:Helix-turn-helix domain-containing protein n=1 Tax=Paenibacillus lemnae TaxID=1330551 RepID=A0A848MA77_PAELE|nr:helix-turn-helix domain-containing protein [Paenibacillus lemnae]NMO97967.1 helix-turn-helix domain-containing protein [Paenibacillus lemnae]